MRALLPLFLLLSLSARAEDAPAPEAEAPTAWSKGSFQDARRDEARKLAEDLLPTASPGKDAPTDKNDNRAAK